MTVGLLGRLNWYELMTSGVAAARRFYPHVAGWGVQEAGEMDPPYTLWTRGGTPVAGLMDLTDEMRRDRISPHWMMYVSTPDVLHTRKHAEALGAATIVPPTLIPDVGRFCVLRDPQGATFAVLQSLRPPMTPETAPQLGDISWHELMTTDDAAAFAFYTTLFGWDAHEAHDMGPMGLYRMFGRMGRARGAIFKRPPQVGAPPHWLLYVRVADLHAAVEQVKARGGKVLNGPMEVPGGNQIAQCLDPQGAAFALHWIKG